LLARLADAGRAKRVGLARPAERRLGLLVRLEERLVRPLGNERGTLVDLVQAAEHVPRTVGRDRKPLLQILVGGVHSKSPLGPCAAGAHTSARAREWAKS